MTKTLKRILFSIVLVVAPVLGAACGTSYEFEPVEVGAEPEADAPKSKTNNQFIRTVYADLLGRSPTRFDFRVLDASGAEVNRFPIDEQSLLSVVLDSSGDTDPMRAVLVAGLVASPEAGLPEKEGTDPDAFVTEQFHRFLGREPSLYEKARFVDAWRDDPAVGPREVVRAIVMSREYQSN